MLWDDDEPVDRTPPALTYGDTRYSYDEDDDEREAMQRECDCIEEHRPGFVCNCDCHPRKPDVQQRGAMFDSAGTFRPNGTRWICADCYIGEHRACDGMRANGASCECRRCGDAARGGA